MSHVPRMSRASSLSQEEVIVLRDSPDLSIEEIGVEASVGAALGFAASFSMDLSISPMGVLDDLGEIVGDQGGYTLAGGVAKST